MIGLEMIQLEMIGLEVIGLEVIGLEMIGLEMIGLEMIANRIKTLWNILFQLISLLKTSFKRKGNLIYNIKYIYLSVSFYFTSLSIVVWWCTYSNNKF